MPAVKYNLGGVMGVILFWFSRYWNRIAYFVLRIGIKMIWDYTGKNKSLLTKDEILSKFTEAIMCGK